MNEMHCKKIQQRLSEYVDGTLASESTWDVEMHLATCAVCAKIANDFAATRKLLQTLPVEGPSPDFEAKLAARLADVSLQPQPLTLKDRWIAWWTAPATRRARPALVTGVALAALLPFAVVRFRPDTAPTITASPSVAQEASLEDLLDDHTASESAQRLEDVALAFASDKAGM